MLKVLLSKLTLKDAFEENVSGVFAYVLLAYSLFSEYTILFFCTI